MNSAGATAAADSAPRVGGDKNRVAQELGANLELGELEQLTITNDNESSYDVRTRNASCTNKLQHCMYFSFRIDYGAEGGVPQDVERQVHAA